MDYLQKLLVAFETHSAEEIREYFENGIDPNRELNGKPLIYELVNMYLRGPKFSDCIKAFVDYGVVFEDKALLAVLADDAVLLESQVVENTELVTKTYSLDCTFTPLFEATLLHICAEYNHLSCAKILVKHGAIINAKAGQISVVFRIWKKPTVKKGGTLKTRKGVLAIENVERIERSEVTDQDIRNAGLVSKDELCEIDREGDFYRITVAWAGDDTRVAMRTNLDIAELEAVCQKLKAMGDWTLKYLQMIHDQPNTHAQILADSVGLEKLKFKGQVRRLKAFGLTESLRPGYKLSPRGERVLEILRANL